jgi:hypothetical protein
VLPWSDCLVVARTVRRAALTTLGSWRSLHRQTQAGSFQPFFRAHAHIETQRREPWLFGDEVLNRLRNVVRTRYTYLPLWYVLLPTLFPLVRTYSTGSQRGATLRHLLGLVSVQVLTVLQHVQYWYAGNAADVGGVPCRQRVV